MTLILAAAGNDGYVYIGADARSAGSYVYSDNLSKLLQIENYVIGVAGSTRVSQLIQYQQDVFSPIEKDADVFFFAACLKQLLVDDGAASTGYERKEESFSILLATAAGIYCMYRNLQFERHDDSWAIGTGDDYGLGYFRALNLDATEARIRTAIVATGKYIHSVGGMVTIRRVQAVV